MFLITWKRSSESRVTVKNLRERRVRLFVCTWDYVKVCHVVHFEEHRMHGLTIRVGLRISRCICITTAGHLFYNGFAMQIEIWSFLLFFFPYFLAFHFALLNVTFVVFKFEPFSYSFPLVLLLFHFTLMNLLFWPLGTCLVEHQKKIKINSFSLCTSI